MKKYVLTLLTSLLLTGCVEQKIIDDINIMSAIGYDSLEDDQIKGTVIIPVYKADKSISSEDFKAIGVQSKEINRKLQQQSADPLENGGVEVVLYGRALAEKGIIELSDTLERDASIGSNLYLAVVDGKAEDILSKQLGNRGTGSYLSTMLEHNMQRRELPRTNLHLFLFSFYSKLKDPFLPYIELQDDKVSVKGVALFDKDKVVSYIGDEEMFFFKGLMENFKNGSYTLDVDGNKVTILSLTLNRDYKIKDAMTNPKVKLSVVMEGQIREFSGEKITPEILKKIEEKMKEEFEKKTEKMLNRFKEMHIDPIGIGLYARTQTRKLSKEKWKEAYPNAEINVKAKVLISETGIVE
jgi:spore germination protein